MTKFSSKKAKISKDWASRLPECQVVKPKHVMRLHGPLLVGVCLDEMRDKERYRPIAHVHHLVRPFPVIALSLPAGLCTSSGAERTVVVDRHEIDLDENVHALMQRYPLIGAVDLSYSGYIDLVRRSISGEFGPGYGYLPHIYCDAILVTAYLGQMDFALAELVKLSLDLKNRAETGEVQIDSVDDWRSEVELAFPNVKEVVNSERRQHKADKIEDLGLTFDVPASILSAQ